MNWDRVQAQWKQLKGKIKSKWGRLTDDGLDVIAGQNDQPIGKIPERHGLKKDEAPEASRGVERHAGSRKRGPNRSRATEASAALAKSRVDSESGADKGKPIGGSFRR
jgi:uncharacterized protein YjbJ (UPF0337 family)